MLRQKNIAMCIIFSFITCGLYYIYWKISLVDDVTYVTNERDSSGIGVLLLSIVTCGIYWFFYVYRMGRKINNAWERKNRTPDSSLSLIFVLLSIFGLDIVTMSLAQNEVNRLSAISEN